MIQLLPAGAGPGQVSDPLSVRPGKSSPFNITFYAYSTVNGDKVDLEVSPTCKDDTHWRLKQTLTCSTPTIDGGLYEGTYQLTDECERIRLRSDAANGGLVEAGLVPET